MSLKIQRLIERAKKSLKNGNIEESEKIYKSILQEFPDNIEATKGLQKIPKNSPDSSPSQNQLDSLLRLYKMSQYDETLKSTQAMIQDYPNESSLFNICGACYIAKGLFNDAITNFQNAIKIKPDYAAGHYNLGGAYRGIGQKSSAIDCYQKAIELNHAYPDAHNNLGLMLLEDRQYKLAIEHFEWAIAYKPDFAEAHNNLGASLQELNKIDECIVSFEKATKLNSEYALAFNNLGIANQVIGQIDYAIKNFEKAIAIDNSYASAYHNLSGIKKFKKDDKEIPQMKKLLANKNSSDKDKTFICFALSKANEDLDNQKEMFKFLNMGNQLRRSQLNYSKEKVSGNHAILKKLFNTKLPSISTNPKDLSKEKNPIFIVGMPRSGSTLIEQILASHNDVHGADEIYNFSNFVSEILNNPEIYTKKGITKNHIETLQSQYLNSLSNLDVNEKNITDKFLANFQFIGFILTAFPNAKIIHTKRDARATCWSIYKHYFDNIGNGWAYNLNDLVEYYGLYLELMDFWHDLFPKKIYDLNYEELTHNQEEETKKLLKYCDLDWDENCLNFQDTKRAVKTASVLQVRQKMYQGSSEAWKKYEKFLQPLIDGLQSY